MSKVAADQPGSRGPSLAEERGPVMAGEGMQAEGTREPGKGWGQQQHRLAGGLWGLPQRKPLQQAASGGWNCLDQDLGKQLPPIIPPKPVF